MKKKFKKYLALLLVFGLFVNLFACNVNNNVPNETAIDITTEVAESESETSVNDVEKNDTEEENSEAEKTEFVEGKYPIHWDLSQIYNNIDEWNEDYKIIENYIATISNLRGTINNADGIYNYICHEEEGYIPTICNKLYAYAVRNKDLDTVNSTYLNLYAKMNDLSTRYGKATSFFEEEMKNIPIDELNKIFEDERLKPYKYYYNYYFLENRPKFSKETIDAVIQTTSNYGANEDTFDALQYADLKKPKITMENGEVKELDDILFDEITHGDYSREIKKNADNLHLGENKDYINTLTSLLYNHMKEVHNNVVLENGDEVLKQTLEDTCIDREIYDNIVYLTHKLLPDLQRFLKIKKERLGYDEMYYIDVLGSYSDYNASSTYDDAVDKVRDAILLLGDEYISKYDEMVTNNHIDVYPGDNKVGGGYTATLGNENIRPYVLLNFTGFVNEVKTIAHELGHAIYSMFSDDNVKILANREPGIFLQEIASTFNENIFTRYMIDNAKDDAEKLYFVEDKINDVNGTLIRQILYSEFEDWLYKKVEKGENFEAEELCDKWMELHKEYYGEAVNFQEGMRYRWASIPHLYYTYYVYKYATSLTYSTILAKEVYEGKDGAKDKYIEFLKSGEPEKPGDILKKIGIDASDKKIYDEFCEYYKSLVDEFDELTK